MGGSIGLLERLPYDCRARLICYWKEEEVDWMWYLKSRRRRMTPCRYSYRGILQASPISAVHLCSRILVLVELELSNYRLLKVAVVGREEWGGVWSVRRLWHGPASGGAGLGRSDLEVC